MNLCKATKTGGSSGTYSVRGFGSELDFADCSSAYATTHPCALGSTTYSFELSISGAGASCSGLPTLDPNVLTSSVSACADKFDGYICSTAACTTSQKRVISPRALTKTRATARPVPHHLCSLGTARTGVAAGQ